MEILADAWHFPHQQSKMEEAMEHKIIGDTMQALEITLNPGEMMDAESGAMMYLTDGIEWDAKMKGGLLKGLARKLFSGESLFISEYRNEASMPAQVVFGAPYPGKIIPIELKGNTVLCEKGAYICHHGNVETGIAFTKKLGAGFFGGEGFILQKLEGHGTAFIHAGGNMIVKNLNPGERLRVDTGCLVAMDSTVDYDIKFIGGFKKSLFGGEGLFYCVLKGPGRVILQTLPFSRMAEKVMQSAGSSTKGESKGVGGILGDIISGD